MQITPTRPTVLEVDLGRLQQNLANIRKHVHPARVMVLVKANAYGHGVDAVARHMQSHVDYYGVALVDEGVHLRGLGITAPIMVLGGILPTELPRLLQHQLTAAISSMELLNAAEDVAKGLGTKLRVHLKIDTGMERTGVHEYEAGDFIDRSLTCSHLDIEGIYTHFANSEAGDLGHARLQLKRFEEVLAIYGRRGASMPRLRHMANSGAILQFSESHFDMVRAGVLFYGVYPGPDVVKSVDVAPAMRWVSHVVQSKITQPGRPVSYGSLWAPDRPVRIITVPCGYGDGYFRRMSNQARVLVNGKAYAQVGRICMDQFMVNVEDDDVRVGAEVVLLGKDSSGNRISPEDMAAWAGTNEYEVMTNINERVPRVFVVR